MKKINKFVSAVTAGIMSLSMMAGSLPTALTSVTAADLSTMTATQLVNEMGSGWNLGNTFDSTNTWTNPLTPNAIETAWGNPTTTQAVIDAIHSSGFDSVRIPVTWFQMTSGSTISEDYLARIKEVVDYCIKDDMFVIINMHHDGLSGNWLNGGTSAKSQFTTMWTQIATYFKDYDRHLVFEGWNEIGWDNATNLTMGQAFVDAVRAAGGNNANRLLVVPAPDTNIAKSLDSGFSMPSDSANMLAVDVHHYDPTTFTVCTPGTEENQWYKASATWGTDAEVNAVKTNIASLKSKFVDNGIGVIFGEYGVENEQKEDASRELYTKTVATLARGTDGFAAYLWDSGNAGDMKYFDRKNLTWYDSAIGQMFSDLGGGDVGSLVVDWIETDFEEVTDSDGNVVPGAYRINVGTSSQVKIVIEAEHLSTGGSGALSYWDSNANDGKGTWVNNGVQVGFSYDKEGVSWVNQLDDEGKDVVSYNSLTIPDGVATDSVQFQMFYVGYADENGDWHDTDVAYPTVVKAYVTGLVDANETTESTTTTETELTTLTTETEWIPTGTNMTSTTESTTETVTETTASTDDTTATTETTETTAPELPDGTLFFLHGQFAGNDLWGDDAYVEVPESGTYTLKWEAAGETKSGDLAIFIDSNVDVYKYALNEDSTGIIDGTLNVTVDSIKVDGVEVPLIADGKLMTMDDGKNLRYTVVNPWGTTEISMIDPAITVAETLEVTFTVQLGLDEDEVVYGDVDESGAVDLLDVILLNKNLLGIAKIPTEKGKANADVNIDGAVDGNDSLYILQSTVSLVTLPIQK